MLSQLCFLKNGDLHYWITCLTSNHGFHLTLQSIGHFQTNATQRQRTQRRPPSLSRLPLAGERGWFPSPLTEPPRWREVFSMILTNYLFVLNELLMDTYRLTSQPALTHQKCPDMLYLLSTWKGTRPDSGGESSNRPEGEMGYLLSLEREVDWVSTTSTDNQNSLAPLLRELITLYRREKNKALLKLLVKIKSRLCQAHTPFCFS